MPEIKVWKLRQGADRRIRSGHPWVFSNELSVSPKGHTPGAPILLQDASGKFVAAGYGNPHSLIAFRVLSFDSRQTEVDQVEFLQEKILRAWQQRTWIGYHRSFRMVYGEADLLSGLVIDRYEVEKEGKKAQVLAVQILSAGIQYFLKSPEKFFETLVSEAFNKKISPYSWDQTAVVIRNDVSVRRLEGLEVEAPKVLKAIEGFDLSHVDILVDSVANENAVLMRVDLIEGQKTGFFLDQTENIALTVDRLLKSEFTSKRIRILDLCCYVGHWSTQLSLALKAKGYDVECTLVDISDKALKMAQFNVDRTGAVTIPKQLDVVDDLGSLPTRHYDIVIADPPAFIKAKKDVPTGRHAYMKMNSSAFKLVQRGGYVVSCSCSQHFIEEEMMETLRKAISRTEIEARCLARGGHAGDHPNLLSFPEGFYLKMFLHQVI